MRRIFLTFIFVYCVMANPVKKAGVVYELYDPIAPEPIELVSNEETVIKFTVENSKSSESFEDPLNDFLANSSGTGDSSSDDEEDEDESISGEISNPVETIKIEGPVENIKIDAPDETIKVDIIPDESVTPQESESYELDGTCLPTTAQDSVSDENGTCKPTGPFEDEEDEEDDEEEAPKIVITKTIITSDDKEFVSSETPDMIINPFLTVPDVEEIIKPDIEDEFDISSDELAFNLIDSNDVAKHEEDFSQRAVREEEDLSMQQRFATFMTALFHAFAFAE